MGQMTDGDLPKPIVDQTLTCALYRSPYTCGMIHWRQSIAHVQTSKPPGLQARRRLQRTYGTVQYLENLMWPSRLRLMVVQKKCGPYLLVSSHMQGERWTSHSILIALRSGLANLGSIAQSYTRDLRTWTARLSWVSPCRINVSSPCPRRIFLRITTLSTRWHLCNKRITPIPQSLFKKVLPENCKTCCAG